METPKQRKRSFLLQVFGIQDKPDAATVISIYEHYLEKSFMITSSFRDIIKRNENRKRRRYQLVINWLLFLVTARYILFCCLYSTTSEVRTKYQSLLMDYWESLGLLGRCLNGVFATTYLPVMLDNFYLRFFQSSGKLEFLTEMESLKIRTKRNNRGVDGLRANEKEAYIFLFHLKLVAFRFILKTFLFAAHLLQVVGCVVFIWKKSDSITTSLFAVIMCSFLCFIQHFAATIFATVFLSFHVTVDYLTTRIKSLISKLQKVNKKFTEKNLVKILNHYDNLIRDIRKRNNCVKYLIRNTCYGYCPAVSFAIFLMTLDMNWWMSLVINFAAVVYILVIICTEMYVGHFQTEIRKLYTKVNSVLALASVNHHQRISYKTLLHFQTAVRELASSRRDGQYTIGLTNGSGAAFTTIDALDIALATVSFTLLILSGAKRYSN